MSERDKRTRELERQIEERLRAEQAEHQRAVRLQLLADVGQKTTAILSRAELLRSAVHIIREAFQYFMVNIFLVDGDDIVARACTMPELQRCVDRLRLGIGREGITGWVAAHGEPLNVPDVRRDPRYRYELEEERQTRSELAVPIMLKGAVTGVLDAQSERESAFTELDVFTLQTVAGQLAVAIENARLYEELQKELTVRSRTETLLRALHTAGLAMEKAPSPEAVLVMVGEELRKAGLLSKLHLTSADGSRASLAYVSSELAREPADAVPSAITDNEAFQAIVQGGQAVFQSGAIVAPLLFEDRLLGFLTVQSSELSTDDIPAIQVFANEIAAAWRKAELVRDLEKSLREHRSTQEQLLQSQKMEAVGRLAGGVAHDFNNQLTAIIGNADMLLKDLAGGDSRRTEVEEIIRAAHRAADLTRQLLAFSRKQVLRPRVIDLNVLVEEMHGMLRRLIGEDVRLETHLAAGPLRVRADAAQLEQVIMNLAVNSRDAMPNGGVLSITTERRTIDAGQDVDLSQLTPGDHCVLMVTDTGTGMDAETLSRLFEPFFTTKERGKGTGLGLSTAYGIVRQSGGHIACRSAPGKGATFTITLPATRDSPDREAPPSSLPPSPGGKETVLVIEDEEAVRELMRRLLARAGYSVAVAGTGVEGMEKLRSRGAPIHLVIADLRLPGGVSGLDIARYVLDAGKETRLLCVSGYSEQLVSGAEGLLPPGAFLRKPFSTSELLQKVREILDAN
ncbi:MAG: ATP-binding protein [Spirochaetia bacterium]